MLNFRTIRSQMYFGVVVLSVIVLILSAASLQGVMKFRNLTKNIRARSYELPLAAKLNIKVAELRTFAVRECWQNDDLLDFQGDLLIQSRFERRLDEIEQLLDEYRIQVQTSDIKDPRFADNSRELEFVRTFERSLSKIGGMVTECDWTFDKRPYQLINNMEDELGLLQQLTSELPVFMQQRMQDFSEKAKSEYRTWITLSILLAIAALAMIVMLANKYKNGLMHPMEKLLKGSREVAAGNFDYRIQLDSDDEVAELGNALNAMTSNFQEIKADLNRQVQLRTKEVVRSEKMASVGFLAAGVAHEINNPLASIAWSAESLESRVYDILNPAEDTSEESRQADIADMKKYLARIQEEAFRCKEITSGLLDFSRMGDVQKVPENLSEIIHSVVDIVKPLSKYRDRNIHVDTDPAVVSQVNSQEIKQVALNLITNALGSVESGGTVAVRVFQDQEKAIIKVTDNGCGLTEEVREHLFEPFFTRRRDGQGTGLGLSITYQIVEDHDGKIIAESDGPGRGSVFTISLPLVNHQQKAVRHAA